MNVLWRMEDVSNFVRIYRLVIAAIVMLDMNLQMIIKLVKVRPRVTFIALRYYILSASNNIPAFGICDCMPTFLHV
jgi:hypothetical protein